MAAGETLGKYEIRRTLGRGSAGVVYEAWDPVIQRRVAIKAVRIDDESDPDTREQMDRFRREAQAAGRLTHPNIVTIHDYGEADGLAYIVMEFVDGPSLRSVLEADQPLARADLMRIMRGVLAGLAFSHEHGIVHRDIKPGNVMLTSPDRTRAQAKLADYGIARIESSSLTQAGTMMGTPAYMAPEQFLGEPVDARSDIYAAGVLLYQLLTGRRPFEGSISSIMHKVLSTDAQPPSILSMDVPTAFDAVVMRALAKRPEQRFESAGAYSAALVAADEADQPADVVDMTIRDPTASFPLTMPPIVEAAPSGKAIVPATAHPTEARGRSALLIGVMGLVVAGGIGATFFLTGTGPPQLAADPPRRPEPTVARAPDVPPVIAPSAEASVVAVEVPPAVVSPALSVPVPPSVPIVTTAPASAPHAVPPMPVAELRDRLARGIAGVRCALVDGQLNGDRAVLSGVAGPGTEATLRRMFTDRDPGARLDWRVTEAGPAFCPTLDAVQPIAPGFADEGKRIRVTLADDRGVLREGDAIRPRVIMPTFSAYLYVDYITHDGAVQHLYPQIADSRQNITADPSRLFAPSEWVNLGDPRPGQRGWEASEPFGRDMIITIASSRPLFDGARPANAERAADYVAALARAIEALRRTGADAVAGAMMVDVVPRQ